MGTQTGSLEEVILQPTRPAPYTGTLKPPVHTQTSSWFLCVVLVVLTSSMAHPPHCAQHTQATALGVRSGERVRCWRSVSPGQRLQSSARTPFDRLNGSSAPGGETLEPQSSETAVHRDWVEEGRRAALPCPGYCARVPALRLSPLPKAAPLYAGLSPGPLREEDRGWLLSDLVTRSHFVG